MNLKTSTPVWRLGTLAAVLALALPAATSAAWAGPANAVQAPSIAKSSNLFI